MGEKIDYVHIALKDGVLEIRPVPFDYRDKQITELLEEIKRLEAVLQWTHDTYCTPAWTDRDLHAPECLLEEKS